MDATLTAVKRLLRWAILIPGVLYIWALLPISFRPHYTGSPLRKPDTTVSVDVVGGAGGAGKQIVSDVGAIGLHKISNERIRQACEAPGLLRPIVRPSQHVVVRYVDNGRVVAQTSYDCKKYT